MYSCIYIYGGRSQRLFRYVDALCLLPLYMYPKTHIARARHHIYFDPDFLLHARTHIVPQ